MNFSWRGIRYWSLREYIENRIKKNLFSIASLYWIGLLVFLVVFHSNHPIDSDEGVVLNGAWNLYNGRKLYFDFIEFIPPGSLYLVFWVWKIFGIGYWTAKFAAIFIIYLGSTGIYKISKKLYGESKFNYLGSSAFAVSSLGWPIINHNTFNIMFIIWAVYYVLKGLCAGAYVSSKELRIAKSNFAISGLLTGFSIIFLQQKGLVSLIAISFYLFSSTIFQIFSNKSDSYIARWIGLKTNAYYLFFALLPVSMLFYKWPAKMLIEYLFVFPFINYSEINKVSYNLFILFAILLIFVIFLLRNEILLNKLYHLIIIIQIALLLTTLPRADYYHIGLAIFPLYSLLASVLKKANQFKFKMAIVCHSIIWIMLLKMTLPALLAMSPFSMMTTDSNVPIAYVKNNCPRSNDLYAGPFLPGIYFETKKLSPILYSFLQTKLHTAEQFANARKMLEFARPACAILNYAMVEKYKHDKNNPVDEFIAENYERVLKEGDIEVYRINR